MIDFWISSRTSKFTVAERHRSNKNYCFWAYYDDKPALESTDLHFSL
jgi:hypothetical protein